MSSPAGEQPEQSRWIKLVDSATVGPGQCVAAHCPGHGDLAVWRTAAGQLCVLDAQCPHQWSDLRSVGVVDGDVLVCTTHFWRFDAEGRVWKQAMSGRRDEKGCVIAHEAREHAGVVWLRVPLRRSSLAQ